MFLFPGRCVAAPLTLHRANEKNSFSFCFFNNSIRATALRFEVQAVRIPYNKVLIPINTHQPLVLPLYTTNTTVAFTTMLSAMTTTITTPTTTTTIITNALIITTTPTSTTTTTTTAATPTPNSSSSSSSSSTTTT